MRRFFLSVMMFLPLFLSFSDEITAYKLGWMDGFRIGYSLKRAKKTRIPSGYWLYIPTDNLPLELIGFYVFVGIREGFDVKLAPDAVVFNVYHRRADAVFWRRFLESKGIRAVVDYREGTVGLKGYVYNIAYQAPKEGIEGILFHLSLAIEKAKDLDPSVINRDLLIKDLKTIIREIEKWKEGKKGYEPAVVSEEAPEVLKKEEKKEVPKAEGGNRIKETIRKFLEEE